MINKGVLKNSSSLVIAIVLSNFCNILFNLYLGRSLSLENFALLTLINSITYVLSILIIPLAQSVNHRVAFLNAHYKKAAGDEFVASTYRKVIAVAIAITLLWLLTLQLTASIFHLSSPLPLLFSTPIILFGFVASLNKGYFQGKFKFQLVAAVLLIEAFSKLILGVLFVLLGYSSQAYLAIPISLGFAFVLSLIFLRRTLHVQKPKKYMFPKRFYAASLLMSFSAMVFLSFDIFLVKHFMSAYNAGIYSLLALVGKMIYFFGSLFTTFIISYVSKNEGEGKSSENIFNKLLLMSMAITFSLYFALLSIGPIIIELFFGQKGSLILPYIETYGLAVVLFTLTNTIATYHLAKKHFFFAAILIFMALSMLVGVYFNHNTINAVVQVMATVSVVFFVVMLIASNLQSNGKFILSNIVSLIDLFFPLPKDRDIKKGKKRILIFNWRDVRHRFAGGAEVYIHELAKRWVKNGHKVTIFCGNDGHCEKNELIEGVQIVRRGGFYFVYMWAFFYYLVKFRGRYDVIIDAQNGIPFFAPVYAKEKVYSLLFHVHQKVFLKSLPKPLAVFAQVMENRIMPWVYRNVEFITISQSTKKEMEKLGLNRNDINIIFPGVDLSKLRPSRKSSSPSILYLGRLKQYKSVDVFLNAAKKVLERLPDVTFIVAGDGEEKKKLMILTKELGIMGNVKFVGKVSDKEKIRLYQEAWVFVNPSYMEGWGITSIEANACGTPVIAADVPGLRDSVNNLNTGYLFRYGDSDKLAERITYILKNQDKREYMSIQSVNWAKKFDWNISSVKCLDIIV
jgi:glycosyltransferase involved in cell wall biosynthesis/O-antigen/teichoic acid export membrane protein